MTEHPKTDELRDFYIAQANRLVHAGREDLIASITRECERELRAARGREERHQGV